VNITSPFVNHSYANRPSVLIVGAGIGGLSAAVRLVAAGARVTVLEQHGYPGGKIRTMDSTAGPVDAGPTVLTMRSVFDDIFAAAGTRLDDHVTLIQQDILARHFWPDGSRLDLFADPDQSIAAVADFAGPTAVAEFRAFCARCKTLFDAFEGPMMQTAVPRLIDLTRCVLSQPTLIRQMTPLFTLAQALNAHFSDPRLAQLFGRYATYVGGSPYASPALLALIWQAEAAGVWAVQGGMHRLAHVLADVAQARGARFYYRTKVDQILVKDGQAIGLALTDGTRQMADAVLFNGDPRALATGTLGQSLRRVATRSRSLPRSHSARVYSFAAAVSGPELAHHNVFFADNPRREFDALTAGLVPQTPTLYICAEDRGQGIDWPRTERFEIIANVPALSGRVASQEKDIRSWHEMIIRTMTHHGLHFDPTPNTNSLTTEMTFARLFPGSLGALYGQSPHDLTSAFKRPTARTPIRNLYLTGGGTHPGAGMPMVAISARHAVEAILNDLTLTSRSVPMAMLGGMLTA